MPGWGCESCASQPHEPGSFAPGLRFLAAPPLLDGKAYAEVLTMQRNPRVQGLFDAAAAAACEELFDAYGVVLERISLPGALAEGLAYCGILGFAGPSVRGTCLLATTEGPLVDSDPVGGPSRDWMGELVNQLVGRIKNRVLSHGVEFYVTIPVVLRGQHIAPLPRPDLPPLAFGAPRGQVLVWIEIETAAGFEPSVVPIPNESAAEGETLIF